MNKTTGDDSANQSLSNWLHSCVCSKLPGFRFKTQHVLKL